MKKLTPVFVSLVMAAAAVLAAVFTANADDTLTPLGTGGLSISVSAVEGTDYTYADNVLTIISNAGVTISGTTTEDRIVADSADGANITLKNISVNASAASAAAFEIAEGTEGKVTVTLSGSNTLTSGGDCAGLQKNGDSSELLINGNGSLTAFAGQNGGGAAIGGASGSGSGNITIELSNSTTNIITLYPGGKNGGTAGGACIGGGNGGSGTNITINEGYIQSSGTISDAAGIGGGVGGSGSGITINGGNLNIQTTGGGAAIGGGKGGEGRDIRITGGTVSSAGSRFGAGIGGGEGADGTDIHITGGYITNSASQYGGAGVGGGKNGNGSNINIILDNQNAGEMSMTFKGNATGNDGTGAGIGGGEGGNGTNITINISGNVKVTAQSSNVGAGIGGGNGGKGSEIKIIGSGTSASAKARVVALGGHSGAAIGGGRDGDGERISISGNAFTEIRAEAGGASTSFGAGIGGGRDASGRDITISGELTVIATGNSGAAIGGGQNSANKPGVGGYNITINGGATVTATGNSGAAIGGGYSGEADGITLENCKKIDARTNGGGGAGIGGGSGSEGRNITIIGCNDVTACGSSIAAGIGGGTSGKGTNIIIGGSKVNAVAGNGGAGAAIGGSNNTGSGIYIYDSYVEAYGGNYSAGIGGGTGGEGSDIHIYTENGETTVIAKSNNGSGYGAGIGGGVNGKGSNITISGNTNITARSSYGAAIGGGMNGGGEHITIEDCAGIDAASAETGAGIGGGANGNGTDITISGGKNITAIGGKAASGIGGGASGNGTDITISGGADVTVRLSETGAGIGGGQGKTGERITIDNEGGSVTIEPQNSASPKGAGIGGGDLGNGNDINILNGKVEIHTVGGAGIGGGCGRANNGVGDDTVGIGSSITIGGNAEVEIRSTGGAGIGGGTYGKAGGITIKDNAKVNVTLTSSSGSAAIGGGTLSSADGIDILGNAEVTVTTYGGAAIGGGASGNGSNINIDGSANVTATSIGGAGIGGGGGTSGVNGGNGGSGEGITIGGNAKVNAAGRSGAGIGGGGAFGGGKGGSGNDIIIKDNAEVTAAGAQGGAGIGGGIFGDSGGIVISDSAVVNASGEGGAGIGGGFQSGECTDITISGGTVKATSTDGGAGIGSNGTDNCVITINGGTVAAIGDNIGIGGGNDNAYVYIRGTGSADYPWVFTNSIGSVNYGSRENDDDDGYWGIVFECAGGSTFTDKENNDFDEGIVYGTNKTVEITEDYTLAADKKLTVLKDVTLITDNKLTVDGSVLYLKEGATLDKWYKTEKVNGGEIQHEDRSEYLWYSAEEHSFINTADYNKLYSRDGSEGIVLCDICGKPEPHVPVIEGDWNWNETHHWHEGTCELGKDCSVNENELTECSYMADGGAFDYGKHRYDFGNPDEVRDGKLRYLCMDCGYPTEIEIPMISLNKVGVGEENDEPLAGAEFGLYTNAGCTGEPYMTGTTAINSDNNAVVSFNYIAGDTTKYIRPGTTYYIKETKAPEGYRISQTVFAAVVGADGKVTYGAVGSASTSAAVPVCRNYAEAVASAPAVLIKTDGEGKPLEGAEFGVYGDEACTVLITTAVTAIDGDEMSDTCNKAVVLFDTEPNKTYYIKETKAPSGYKKSDKVFAAVVGADGKVTYGVVGTPGTSKDIPVCENVAEAVVSAAPAKIIKVDGEGKPLEGAEFGIYGDEACTVLITTAVTAIDGDEMSDTYNKAVVLFDTEPNKTYYIKETKAPSGYKKSDKVFAAVIGADGKVTYGVVGTPGTSKDIPVCENKRLPAEKNPDTGAGVGAAGLAGAAVLVDIIHASKKGAQRRRKKNGDDSDIGSR